jgi:Mycobacterium membrane protein
MATGASAFTRLQSDGRLVARLAEGDCVATIPVADAVKKVWVALVIVLVVVVAAFCVTRLRTFFGHDNRPIAGGISDDVKPFNPKHVVYQVFGPAGTVADINYLDINATPQ